MPRTIIALWMLAIFWAFPVFATGASNNQMNHEVYSTALEGKDKEFLEGVLKRIDGRHGKQKVVKIADFKMIEGDGPNIHAEYVLKNTPLSLEAAKKDALEVLVFMVKELLALGINPAKNYTMVSLRLCEHETGMTGQKLVRSYGRWRYDPTTDNAEWLPPGK
ncbi:hypothetical protein [uncultured Desulfovibrio sp.]|uniref:hypothetical protein n=1 Tax=uncultured Desulfovibrio sp. TaxID=167968 RepID=UPI0027120F7D|nr:hypothetical protein [uncultured Desulfovibrio sp.]